MDIINVSNLIRLIVVVLTLLTGSRSLAGASLPYPTVDTAIGEYLHEGEQQHAQAIGDIVEQQIRARYGDGLIKRDAHPKAHGCPVAEFRVARDIPLDLQSGVFVPGAVYESTVRFSNGSADAEQADEKGDTRGMAIKLRGVQGSKLTDVQAQADAQDFLLISHPVFFVNDAADYAEFFAISASGDWRRWLKLPFVLGLRGSYNAFQMLRSHIDNPLAARYWSVVPYQLGEGEARQAVKYSVKPCQGSTFDNETDSDDPNFLRAAMAAALASSSSCMAFMVQRKPGPDYSIENVVERWPENSAPFETVAELHFSAQTFDSAEQLMRCEEMVFNPWHGLLAHKPLGAVNRIRKVVYDRIRRVRESSF